MAITVEKLVKDLNLEVLVKGDLKKDITISNISRPGLQFAGYYDYFGYLRLQVLGMAEWSFLNTINTELRKKRFDKFFEFDIPAIIMARNLEPHEELIQKARENNVWVLRDDRITTRLISKVTNYLDRQLAQQTTMHGVLVDVYGIGILITGESGIGKSETALELIKRGHRLVSDDAVEIRCIDKILYGTSPYITSGMLEVRGMGIIDIPVLYGLSSILEEKVIEFVIHLTHWKEDNDYDRLGIDKEIKILDASVNEIDIPVRPGRNIAVIIEAAAANYRYGFVSKISPVEKINRRIYDGNKFHQQ
jgi:HPr kinase/phosphorylase